MSRYIDAEKIKADHFVASTTANTTNYLYVSLSQIENAPTADVVKVVRCKECVHHKNAPQTTDVWCERIDGLLPKDWFCADGERREDENR